MIRNLKIKRLERLHKHGIATRKDSAKLTCLSIRQGRLHESQRVIARYHHRRPFRAA